MRNFDKIVLPSWHLFLYLIMIGLTFISMPQGGVFYLVTRVVQAIEMIFFVILCMIFYKQGIRLNKFNTLTNLWFILYIFLSYAFISGKGLTPVFGWLNIIIFLLLGICYWQNAPQDHFRYLAFAFSFLIYLNAILLILFPDGLWIDHTWVGRGDSTRYLLGHYNQMGFVCLLGITIQTIYTLSTKKGVLNLFLLVIISLWSVFFVGSMTSAVGLSLFAVYLLIHNVIKRPKIYLICFVIIYVLFFTFIVWCGNSIEEVKLATNFIESTLSKDTSFSLRTVIWDNAVYQINQSPWIGHGVQDVEWNDVHLGASGPHNLWLMFLLQGGIALCIAFIGIVTFVIKRALKVTASPTTAGVVALCIFFLMSLFETFPIVPIFLLLQSVYYAPVLIEDKEQTQHIKDILA